MGDVVGASPTDADLVAASLHDPQRFALLFDRHARAVHRYVASRARHGDVDDVVSETFLTAFRNRARYDRSLRRRPAVAARHRHQCPSPPPPVRGPAPDSPAGGCPPLEDEVDPAESVAAAVDDASEIDRVARALARLDDRYRDVLLLAASADLTYDEIARALGDPGRHRSVAPRPRPPPASGTPRRRRATREGRRPRRSCYRRDPRMIDELEILRRYIDATVDPDPDLEPVRRRLVTAIEEEGAAVTGRADVPCGGHIGRDQPAHRDVARQPGGGRCCCGRRGAPGRFAPPAPHGPPKRPPSRSPSHLSVGDQLRLVADRAGRTADSATSRPTRPSTPRPTCR